jgi:hypothetical protein
MSVQLMSQAEYARHRGCNPAAVTRAIQEKRISLINGKIDPVVADVQWAANTRARADSKPATEKGAQLAGLAPAPAAKGDAGQGGDGKPDDYLQSRARREAAEAEMAELALLERKGDLVNKAQVRAELASQLSAFKDSLLQVGARLAPLVAAESDIARCQQLIDAELHAALHAFTTAGDHGGT